MPEPPTTEITRTRRLEIVDDHDRVRIVAGETSRVAESRLPAIQMLDQHGRSRVRIEAGRYGPLLIFDQDGNDVVILGVLDPLTPGDASGPYLALCDEDGTPVRSWDVSELRRE